MEKAEQKGKMGEGSCMRAGGERGRSRDVGLREIRNGKMSKEEEVNSEGI